MKRLCSLLFTLCLICLFSLPAQAFIGDMEGLVAGYEFAGNADDMSGNGNHGTLKGPGVTLTQDRFGRENNAYFFDGQEDSFIYIAHDPTLDMDRELTISGWFNVAAYQTEWMGIINKAYDDPVDTFEICVNEAGFIHFPVGMNGSRKTYDSEAGQAFDGWQHFAVSYDGAQVRIYLNGVLNIVYDSAPDDALLTTNDHFMSIGAELEPPKPGDPENGVNYFLGSIDDLYIFDHALGSDEINGLYTATPNAVPLPSALLLMGSGLLGLTRLGRRNR